MSLLVATLLFGTFLFFLAKIFSPQIRKHDGLKEPKPDNPHLFEDEIRKMRNRNEWP